MSIVVGPERCAVGGYELLEPLGVGGMTSVYMAKHEQQDGFVALKLPKREIIERAGGAAAFLREIRTATSLEHPNIVLTRTSGTHEGQPFLVMSLLEGGTLADKCNRRQYREPKLALEVMLKIAKAVDFAHRRDVFHCDLKPANILLDSKGEPYVSDFGLAQVLQESASSSDRTGCGGTWGWMSPEQVEGKGLRATSDVFALGLMLHWLLTGKMAFGNGEDFRQRVVSSPRPSPGPWRPTLRWTLGAIVERALQVDIDDRYGSPGELADELGRARRGLPVAAERNRAACRAFKWVGRHRLVVLGIAISVALLISLPIIQLSVLGELKNIVRYRNVSHAAAQAGAVMNELRSVAELIEAKANNPSVRKLVDHPDLYDPASALNVEGTGLDAAFVLDESGMIRARWPSPGEYRYPDRYFGFRDYFHCQNDIADARARHPSWHIPGVCVSRALHNTSDNRLYIGFSAPIYDNAGRHVGAVLASTKARTTFGAVQMNCTGLGDCMTALLGPRDRGSTLEPLPQAILILAEPGLVEGTELSLPAELSSLICKRFGCERRLEGEFEPRLEEPLVIDDYIDPVTNMRSLAAAAPVGHTGLIVLVATPTRALDAFWNRSKEKAVALLPAPLALVGFLAVLLYGIPALLAFVARRRAV
jgi:serine/threonine protein kinase